MSGRATFVVLGLLLALLTLETALAYTPVPRLLLPGIGLVMVVVVAFWFMRLRAGGALVAIFALAGMFWLSVMMMLGGLDPATRTDIPVHQTDIRSANGGMPPR